MIGGNLLDLNVLIALTDETHQHHHAAKKWLHSPARGNWGICPLTESGYLRVTANPAMHAGTRDLKKSLEVLEDLATQSGYCYWSITESWAHLTAPFADRIIGQQQVTDAYLLGLAIKENGVLVTFDKAIRFLAGPEFANHVMVIE